MSFSDWFLALFLALLSLQLGLSMELPLVSLIGTGLSLLGVLKILSLERPTWGLIFVLLAAGGFIGSELLDDMAPEGSWAQSSALVAGVVLSIWLYLLWLFAAREKSNLEVPVQRDSQTILAVGLLLLLLIPPPDNTVVTVLDLPIPLLAVAAILLTSLVLLADRCTDMLISRLLMLTPIMMIVPFTAALLTLGQGPVVAALENLFPRFDNYSATGFSPIQTLNASVFLQPSNRAVMRLESAVLTTRYLAGNRLVTLDEDYTWRPSARTRQSLRMSKGELMASGEWRYTIDNNHANAGSAELQNLAVHNLSRSKYLFLSPGTRQVTGNFGSMSKNAADVWIADFDRGTDRRWKMAVGGDPNPQAVNAENLHLPEFWDEELQQKSLQFLGDDQQQTVNNVIRHFARSEYSLQTNFDPQRPFHDFFLNEQAGYCFWFATATTLALRANGIPSRLVGGYVIHERLSAELWLVRERDAHSWVEWQDAIGYWHTIDPTPVSISTFFDDYQSRELSIWYHYLAGQWQTLVDRVLAEELTANLVRYGGTLILIFLFGREYRRIRGQKKKLDPHLQQWQKLWQGFLRISELPVEATWTASTYAENLPAGKPASWHLAVRGFLQSYNLYRFSQDDEQAIAQVEKALEECTLALSRSEKE